MGKSTISMAIFNSYVSLPEGISDLSGWWLGSTPLKNDWVGVSWDDEIPNMMRKIIQMFQTTNQL